MLFFLQKSIPSMDMWLAWLSSKRRTLLSGDAFVWLWKCWRKIQNSFSCIHPDPLAAPIQPDGPSRMKCGLNFLLGKMKKGGMEFPKALTAQAVVIRVPRSPDVTAPTCLMPFFPDYLDRSLYSRDPSLIHIPDRSGLQLMPIQNRGEVVEEAFNISFIEAGGSGKACGLWAPD